MSKGLGLLLIGVEGIGKTTFASEFPKPLTCFSIYESGFEDFMEMGIISPKFNENLYCDSYGEMIVRLNRCQSKTIVIDSLSGYQSLLFEDLTAKPPYNGDKDKFYDYYKGPRLVAPPFANDFCNILENKRRQGHHIVVLAHDRTTSIKNPRGLDYTASDISVDEGIREIFKHWAPNILYMTLDPGIDTVTKELKGVPKEARMKEDDVRIIFTRKSLVHSAKNKLNLPTVIPMGSSSEEAYDNFVKHLPPYYKEQLSE